MKRTRLTRAIVALAPALLASTALALSSEEAGLPLVDHLNYVNALALLLLVALPVGLYGRRMAVLRRQGASI